MPLVLKVTNGPCRHILFLSLVFFPLTCPKANYLNRALKSSQKKIALAMCRESKVNFEPFLQKAPVALHLRPWHLYLDLELT